MAVGGYKTDQSDGKEDDRDYYGEDSLHHNFVTVIPVDYPRQNKFSTQPTNHHNTQNLAANQEESRNYPLNEKESLENMAVLNQSSHVLNRTMAMVASVEKPPHHQTPSGQCKLKSG